MISLGGSIFFKELFMNADIKPIKVEKKTLPAIPLRGLVIFPGMLLQFDVGREKSVLALEKAMDADQLVFLVAQQDITDDDPKSEKVYGVGVVAKVKQVIRRGENGMRLFAEGLYRAEILSTVSEKPYFTVSLMRLET
ncbi:MAG TPA: endopeptidase La, partial [Ruminococcaceae bacterium]|nr:endopeptidase La [Oscillospiraceae bacterium]